MFWTVDRTRQDRIGQDQTGHPNFHTTIFFSLGCCPDGEMDAEGPNFEGCNSTVPIAEPKVCGFPKDRGSGKNYTMFWFFDMEYGGCSRYVHIITNKCF